MCRLNKKKTLGKFSALTLQWRLIKPDRRQVELQYTTLADHLIIKESSNADIMSQHTALTGLFTDDPFFGQERLLWPLHHNALSALQQDFFNRRAKLADSLLRELQDGHPLLRLNKLPFISSTLARYVQELCLSSA